MADNGLEGTLAALRELGAAFEDASAEFPPLLHELLIALYPRTTWPWWEGFLENSYFPRPILSGDGKLYLAEYPAGDWGDEWPEVFPDGHRCSRFHGHRDGLERFRQLAARGYDLMRAVASHPANTSPALSEAVRNPGFRFPGHDIPRPHTLFPSEAAFPYGDRGRFAWVDLLYRTARLYPVTCEVSCHMFGDSVEERRHHHHNPDIYSAEAFATEFNVEILGSTTVDAFDLAARVIDLWLSPPRPIEAPPPVPINLWQLAEASRPRQPGDVLDPAVTRPTWDGEARELRWGEVVLKRFTKPAKNQTTVLACFEEDGWPELIDDPLPPGRLKSKRLGDTVRALNQDMERPGVVVFKPARLGKAVRWAKKP